jgi:hypothetical protein
LTTTFTQTTALVDPGSSISRGCYDGAFVRFENNSTAANTADDLIDEEGVLQIESRGAYTKYYHALYQVRCLGVHEGRRSDL